MTYSEGVWHDIIGLDPQYEHMKGCPAYEDYMRGYNDKDDGVSSLVAEHIAVNDEDAGSNPV